MKNHSCYIALALLLGAGLAARGESSGADINPALTYYQSFDIRPELSSADRDYLFGTNEWRGQMLPERFGQLIKRFDNEFKLAQHAAHATAACDWGIDWTPGPDTLLPHLSRIKGFANETRLRVLWELQQGRQTDARDDLLAAVAMARNGATDGSLISVLVQIACEHIVCQSIAENFYRFSPETLQQLVDGLNGPPARRTVASAMTLETTQFPEWLVNRLLELQKEYPGNDARALEAVRPVFTDNSEQAGTNWPHIVTASGGTVAGMIKLVHDLQPFYTRLVEVENAPLSQYTEGIRQFSEDVEKSPNPLAHETLPAITTSRTREFGMVAQLAMVQAAVEYKLRGMAGFQSVADPCGQGPFTFERFIFDGVDRGFKVKSAYTGQKFPTVLIFVEADGPPFYVDGLRAAQPCL